MTTTPLPPASPPPCGICGHGYQFHYAQGGEEGCAMHIISESPSERSQPADVVECHCPRYEPKSYDEEPGPTRPEIDHPFGREIVLAKKPNEWPIRALELDSERGLDDIQVRNILKNGHRAWLVRIEVVAELELVEPKPFIQPKDPL